MDQREEEAFARWLGYRPDRAPKLVIVSAPGFGCDRVRDQIERQLEADRQAQADGDAA